MKDFKTKNGFFTGNVGIGTTDPDTPLHVNSDSGINGLIKLKSSDIEASVVFEDNGSTDIVNIGCRNDDLKLRTDAGNITFFTDSEGTASERMRIDSDGNVGIGTTSPDFNLSVVSDTNPANIGIHGYGSFSDGTVAAQLLFLGKDSNGGNRNLAHIQVREHAHAFGTGSMEFFTRTGGNEVARMTIGSNGNVGIGTTGPSAKLVIQEDSVVNTLTEAVSFLGGNYTSASNAESFKFFHQTNTANTNRGAAFKSINGSLQIQTIVTSSNADAANNISLQPGGGNVGIGTTSPGAKLEVYGNSTGNLYPTVHNNSAGNAGWRLKNNQGDWVMIANAALRFYDVGQGLERMRIDSEGDVGIGTTSTVFSAGSGLRIERDATATLRLQDTGANGFEIRASSVAAEFYNANSKPFTFETGGSEVMRITSAGNVGIGTQSPNHKLDLYSSAERSVIANSSVNMTNAGWGNYITTNTEASGATASHGVLIGCYRETTSDAFVGVIRMHQRNFTKQHLWFDNNGTLRTSTNGSHIGESNLGNVIGDQTSDERLKDIAPSFDYGLEQVMQLKPIDYKFKDDKNETRHLGFGAQSTRDIIPEVVYDTQECIDGYDADPEDEDKQIPRSEDTKFAMKYVELVPVLTKAIQEQQQIIEDLKSQNESLIARIEALEG